MQVQNRSQTIPLKLEKKENELISKDDKLSQTF